MSLKNTASVCVSEYVADIRPGTDTTGVKVRILFCSASAKIPVAELGALPEQMKQVLDGDELFMLTYADQRLVNKTPHQLNLWTKNHYRASGSEESGKRLFMECGYYVKISKSSAGAGPGAGPGTGAGTGPGSSSPLSASAASSSAGSSAAVGHVASDLDAARALVALAALPLPDDLEAARSLVSLASDSASPGALVDLARVVFPSPIRPSEDPAVLISNARGDLGACWLDCARLNRQGFTEITSSDHEMTELIRLGCDRRKLSGINLLNYLMSPDRHRFGCKPPKNNAKSLHLFVSQHDTVFDGVFELRANLRAGTYLPT